MSDYELCGAMKGRFKRVKTGKTDVAAYGR